MNLSFKDYELTQMSQEELLDKAVRLYSFMSDLKPNVTIQMCLDQVIRAYASYNPDEEKVGTYA
jgi:hypothetical protein